MFVQKRTLERKLKYQYGMTVEDYWQMSEGQDHRCAICREPCATGQRLSVDHDHGRRKVRGLLCRTRNKTKATDSLFKQLVTVLSNKYLVFEVRNGNVHLHALGWRL